MNRPIVRLYGLVTLLFALLIGFTSRWTVFESSALRHNEFNARPLLEQQRIARGAILAANGDVLAHSIPAGEGTYRRTYPAGDEFAQAIGYYFNTGLGSSGLEQFRSSALNGENNSGVQEVLDQLQGKQPGGEKVLTTLDPVAQRVANTALAGHRGAIVALDPRTGAVSVMASSPAFNPNALSSESGYKQIRETPGSPLINRATQFGYPPGSTFKLVTATAAIDTGAYTPQSVVNGRNGVAISGVALNNDDNENYPQITLTKALALSVNTAFAQVAVKLGKPTIARYMDRFGFDRTPQLDYPASEMTPSGEYRNGRLIAPTSPFVDVGRLGIGQDKLNVTALQMAEVAATVANHGTLMVPHLTDRIVDSEGRTVQQVSPRVQSQVMKSSTAAALTSMMEAVVNEGTGTAAKIPGIQVAGKTGTAETQFGNSINNVWFVAFAPAADPRMAVAVTLEKVPGQGAQFAAPVAREVMESLLHD